MRISPTKLVIVTLALAATLSITLASAQEKSTRKNSGQADSSSTATKSRNRRVTTKAASEPSNSIVNQPPLTDAPSENEAQPTVRTTNANGQPTHNTASAPPDEGSGEKATDPTAIQQEGVGGTNAAPDNLKSLRDQIGTAPSGSERIRLQLRLSELLVESGKKAEATQELRSIIAVAVFDPQTFYNVGNALVRLGQPDEAIDAYRKAINQRKGNYSRALNNLGVILLRQGRWDEAHEALLSALRLENFRYAEASYNLGRLYSARGEGDMAVREWSRTLSIDPQHPAAAQAISLGSRESVIRKPEASAKTPRPISVDSRMPGLSTANTGASPPLGKSSASSKALTLDPVSYEFLQRARNLRERGKHQEAVENYQSVLSRSHGYFPPANLEISYALLMLQRTDEAFANLSAVAKRDGPLYPITYFFLARLYEAKGDLKEAEELFSKVALVYKSKNSSFLLDLSRVRERQKNFKGALTALEEYVTAMEFQGLKPAWSDQALTVLREKASKEPR